MEIWIFGNPDDAADNLPLRLLPKLRKVFPNAQFIPLDPNEDREPPADRLIVLDTAHGIKRVKMFSSLDAFEPAPRVTLHDFDAYAHLKLLEKLKKLPLTTIIGVPANYDEAKALDEVIAALRASGL